MSKIAIANETAKDIYYSSIILDRTPEEDIAAGKPPLSIYLGIAQTQESDTNKLETDYIVIMPIDIMFPPDDYELVVASEISLSLELTYALHKEDGDVYLITVKDAAETVSKDMEEENQSEQATKETPAEEAAEKPE